MAVQSGAPYATVREAASYLNCHPVTLRGLVRSGEFPRALHRGRGSRIFIPWSDVRLFLVGRQPRVDVGSTRAVASFLALHPNSVTVLYRRGSFPNAYRVEGGSRGPIMLPWSDVERYRQQQPRVSR